jgi:hypothetical protein
VADAVVLAVGAADRPERVLRRREWTRLPLLQAMDAERPEEALGAAAVEDQPHQWVQRFRPLVLKGAEIS